MRIKRKGIFWTGTGIFIAMIAAMIIPITYTSFDGYTIHTTLLALLIFYNKYVLAVYVLAALFLIYKGIDFKR